MSVSHRSKDCPFCALPTTLFHIWLLTAFLAVFIRNARPAGAPRCSVPSRRICDFPNGSGQPRARRIAITHRSDLDAEGQIFSVQSDRRSEGFPLTILTN